MVLLLGLALSVDIHADVLRPYHDERLVMVSATTELDALLMADGMTSTYESVQSAVTAINNFLLDRNVCKNDICPPPDVKQSLLEYTSDGSMGFGVGMLAYLAFSRDYSSPILMLDSCCSMANIAREQLEMRLDRMGIDELRGRVAFMIRRRDLSSNHVHNSIRIPNVLLRRHSMAVNSPTFAFDDL